MMEELNAVEQRVLGALIEKEMTTPDYYPLSLNSLASACNQKSNRNPVVQYDDKTIVRALDELKSKQMVWQSDASRVPKYGENFVKLKKLLNREAAIIALLLVRGPQTVGELRGRSERLCSFEDLAQAQDTLTGLIDLDFVIKLPRQPGRKENRYCHLLGGEPDLSVENTNQTFIEPATQEVRAENERIAELEEEMGEIKAEMAQLQQAFTQFKSQFE